MSQPNRSTEEGLDDGSEVEQDAGPADGRTTVMEMRLFVCHERRMLRALHGRWPYRAPTVVTITTGSFVFSPGDRGAHAVAPTRWRVSRSAAGGHRGARGEACPCGPLRGERPAGMGRALRARRSPGRARRSRRSARATGPAAGRGPCPRPSSAARRGSPARSRARPRGDHAVGASRGSRASAR